MIFVKGIKSYYQARFNALLKRLETVTQEHENDLIPDSAIIDIWSEIGRLVLYASETLPENDYIEVMANLDRGRTLKARNYRSYYIHSIIP